MKIFLSILVILFLFDGLSIFNIDLSSTAIRLSDKRHAIDWESLLSEEEDELKRALAGFQRSSDRLEEFDDFFPLDRHTRKPKKISINRDEGKFEELFGKNRFSRLKTISTIEPTRPVEQENVIERAERLETQILPKTDGNRLKRNNFLFFTIVVLSSVAGILSIVGAVLFWFKIQQRARQAELSEFPAFVGPKISPSSTVSDRKLAQSAQMFHYQQQRQQMIARERARLESSPTDSDDSADENGDQADHTVYECPGLATTGEMEVRNPLYDEKDLTNDEKRFFS